MTQENQGQRQPEQRRERKGGLLRTIDITLFSAGLLSACLSLRGTPTEGYLSAPDSFWSKVKKGYLIERVLYDIPSAIVSLDPTIVTNKLPNINNMGGEIRNVTTNAYDLWPPNADTFASPLTSYLAMYASYLPFKILRKYIVKPLRGLKRMVSRE